MERRKFIGSAGLAGILASGLAPAAHANQSIRWRLVSSFPKTLDITYGGAMVFAREAREMSGGKIDIAVHAAEELMPAFNVLDGVQRGVVECAHTAPHYFIVKDECFALDCAIPFGLNARQMNAWMRHGNGLALLRDFYKAYGIVNFPLGNTGAQMGGWYRKPIRSPGDIKGLRMRIANLGGMVLQRIGGVPVSLAGGDIYKALEHGEIAAAEWVGPHDDLKLGLHKLCKYYAYPSWWEGGTQLSLYINQRAYESLTAENQSIVEAAAAAAHLEMQSQYDARNPVALKALVATGTQLMPLPKTVLDAAYKAAQELYAELAERNPNWRKIHGSYAAFLKDQAWAWGHAEMGFDGYMHRRALEQLKTAPGKKSVLAPRR